MIKFFVDGEVYPKSDFSKEEKDFFLNNGYIKPFNSNFKVKCCGILRFNSQNYVFLPKGFNQKNANKTNSSFLFQAIRKYKGNSFLDDDEKHWLSNENKEANFLDLNLWIVEDYLTHGFYHINENIIEENGKGRIKWQKTIKEKIPLIKNNNLLYWNVLTTKNNVNINHIITKIHKKIVFECINSVGWLLSLAETKEHVENLNLSIDKQIILLEKKLKETFSSHEIILLQKLINYLKLSVDDEKKNLAIITDKFENIWEEMLKLVFAHDYSIKIPQPYWNLSAKRNANDSKKQIPDILIKIDNLNMNKNNNSFSNIMNNSNKNNNDLIAVFDAKYYSIKEKDPSTFPGWPDIVKQLFYAMSLKTEYNIFLFPMSVKDDKFKYLGYSSVEGRENDFGYVFAFGVDVEEITKSYIYNEKRKDICLEIIDFVKLEKEKL